jgi:mono/diheme cytochrome c family protein
MKKPPSIDDAKASRQKWERDPSQFGASRARAWNRLTKLDEGMMRALFLACLAVGAGSVLATAQAQPASSLSDEVQNGHYLAVLMCSSCHVASPDQSVEPVLQPPAPSLESIAKRGTTSSDTIREFLATTHRSIRNPAGMPNPELLDVQTRQVVAYLLSLREASAAAVVRKPPAAQKGSCRAEITRLELVLGQARARGQRAGNLPESSAARLHRQPTVQSVEQATSEAEKTIETALALARKLEAEGLDAECAAMLGKIEPPSK